MELAVAVHYVFDTPEDRIVWDGGHQAYPHKVLTGRRDRLHTIRQPGGLAAISAAAPRANTTPSVSDTASTSISAALGMAVASAQQRRIEARCGDHR